MGWLAVRRGDPAGSALEVELSDSLLPVLPRVRAGVRREFDLPLAPNLTPYQLRVWSALRAIPSGETRSYGALASALGEPGAARAVGAANRTNPIGIIVPCHRVIGADGSLTGYAGGIERKKLMLEHEARIAARGQMALELTGGKV